MASTLPGESSAHPDDEAQALRDEIEQTREHLGDTVEQLAAKADVKKQARAGAARLADRLRVAQRKVAEAGQAGREKVRIQAAQAKKTAPGQARHALDKSARIAREQRGPLAAAVGALVAALAALIIWKRRKRS
jgi:LPXTG-motif cell wall-anchored protein